MSESIETHVRVLGEAGATLAIELRAGRWRETGSAATGFALTGPTAEEPGTS